LAARSKAGEFKSPPSLFLSLSPLVETAFDLLAAKIVQRELDAESCEKLTHSAEGDPLHLELLVAWLKERRAIKLPADGGPASISIEASAFPKTEVDLVCARVALLPANVQKMVLVAATGKEIFDSRVGILFFVWQHEEHH